jgi:hypothetical protein
MHSPTLHIHLGLSQAHENPSNPFNGWHSLMVGWDASVVGQDVLVVG